MRTNLGQVEATDHDRLRFAKKVGEDKDGHWFPLVSDETLFAIRGNTYGMGTASWLLFVGPLLPHEEVVLECGERGCLNPDHMRKLGEGEHRTRRGVRKTRDDLVPLTKREGASVVRGDVGSGLLPKGKSVWTKFGVTAPLRGFSKEGGEGGDDKIL